MKAKPRKRAAVHGRSTEEAGLSVPSEPKLNFAESIRRHIEPLGGVELTLPRRDATRRRLSRPATQPAGRR
jgi:hypothetical protein